MALLLSDSTTQENRIFPVLNSIRYRIKKCEQNEILPRITSVKFEEFKTKLKNATAITDAADLKLLDLIRNACASYSLAWSMMRYSVNLYPQGVLQHTTSDRMSTQGKKPALNAEPEAARQAFQSDFETFALAIEELLAEPIPEEDADDPIEPFGCNNDKYFST